MTTTTTPTTTSPTTTISPVKALTTKAPATKAPATKAPATKAPATKAPATKAPATKAPATKAPATKAPATKAPTAKTADNPVLRVAPASPAAAAAYFGASLAFHADVSDVAGALTAGGDPGFVVLDSRSTASWDQGHVPGAVHLPTALIPEHADQLLDRSVPVVTYCWGPGCNGATRAALALAELGFQVKEMLGGFEYWVREGFAYETWEGREHRAADPLTAPVDADDCGC